MGLSNGDDDEVHSKLTRGNRSKANTRTSHWVTLPLLLLPTLLLLQHLITTSTSVGHIASACRCSGSKWKPLEATIFNSSSFSVQKETNKIQHY